MHDHEATAADISRARIGDGHGKAGRDRRIDGVATLGKHVGADFRRVGFSCATTMPPVAMTGAHLRQRHGRENRRAVLGATNRAGAKQINATAAICERAPTSSA